MGHAFLSPSGASRWLACTPSARFEAQFPSTSNAAADEGTLAHALGELYIKNHLKLIKAPQYATELKKIKNNQYFNAELNGHATDYASFILDKFAGYNDGFIFIEDRIDLTEYVPEGFGTADAVIISEGVLDLNDLKYGKGVLVEAHENKQLMLYALGALRKYELMFNIDTVKMTIYQPRLHNYSSYELSAETLRTWGDFTVKEKAQQAFTGKGEFKAGSHCKFCKGRNQCKALADYNMDLAKFVFEDPNKLTDDGIAEILTKAPEFKVWLTSVQDYALQEATQNQKKWPGFKLVRGRSNRQYASEDGIKKALQKAKLASELWLTEPKLVGIGALEKNLGKDKVEQLCGQFIIKPEGAPTLVPDWDKRPEMSSAESAADAFANVETNG